MMAYFQDSKSARFLFRIMDFIMIAYFQDVQIVTRMVTLIVMRTVTPTQIPTHLLHVY